jgi:hypothetical protein
VIGISFADAPSFTTSWSTRENAYLTQIAGQRCTVRDRATRFSRRMTPETELLAELDERLNAVARYRADLDADNFTDGDADQLRGGMAYENFHIEGIVSELEGRVRARNYGYRPTGAPVENDLSVRFAAAKAIDTADVIRDLTGQPSVGTGKTTKFPCPFHGDGQERTPSLVAYADGHFHCYACGVHGADAVAFVAEFLNVGQVEALRLLEAGVLGARVPA